MATATTTDHAVATTNVVDGNQDESEGCRASLTRVWMEIQNISLFRRGRPAAQHRDPSSDKPSEPATSEPVCKQACMHVYNSWLHCHNRGHRVMHIQGILCTKCDGLFHKKEWIEAKQNPNTSLIFENQEDFICSK